MKDDQTTPKTNENGRSKKKYERPQIVTYGHILEVTHGGPMTNLNNDNVPPPGQFKSN